MTKDERDHYLGNLSTEDALDDMEILQAQLAEAQAERDKALALAGELRGQLESMSCEIWVLGRGFDTDDCVWCGHSRPGHNAVCRLVESKALLSRADVAVLIREGV